MVKSKNFHFTPLKEFLDIDLKFIFSKHQACSNAYSGSKNKIKREDVLTDKQTHNQTEKQRQRPPCLFEFLTSAHHQGAVYIFSSKKRGLFLSLLLGRSTYTGVYVKRGVNFQKCMFTQNFQSTRSRAKEICCVQNLWEEL